MNKRTLNQEEISQEYGIIARSIAPIGLMMAVFNTAYSLWFGFAWGIAGWIIFALTAICNIYILCSSLSNIRHARQFEAHETEDSRRIGRQMGILSGISYSSIWILAIILPFFHGEKYIFPMLTMIIGLHFIPQAKIMNRKIDYLTAPFPIVSAGIAFYLAFSTETDWLSLAALAAVGGAIATLIYGFYMLDAYQKAAAQYQVPYP
ncbi:hypothetical protein ACVRXQ_11065 [Streptococcus panodentis]|uniref:Uncharacterized protein n=1 Tax=Streptococcus panodentis TaxID=1581472 RepID=A0ABS5AYJ7_9STRE|nr:MULTISPECIES: hypothetical protein [Streptococcus]KXT83647.1 hypothetical protein STRDD11_01373 [Streptococcus sp. DD11]MBP2621615.1 hypothetical protein [Streptococcus panodentis]